MLSSTLHWWPLNSKCLQALKIRRQKSDFLLFWPKACWFPSPNYLASACPLPFLARTPRMVCRSELWWCAGIHAHLAACVPPGPAEPSPCQAPFLTGPGSAGARRGTNMRSPMPVAPCSAGEQAAVPNACSLPLIKNPACTSAAGMLPKTQLPC